MSREISKGDVYRKYVFDESARTTKLSMTDLEKYVDSLDDHKAKELCHKLSHSRKNSVFRFISNGPDLWTVKTVSISKIYMGGINKKVNERYFIGNCWLLKRIAKDKGVRKNREFKKRGEIHKRSRSLIAHKTGSSYKIVDGNHRAIKLAVHGQKEFELIFYRKQ